MEKNNEDSIRDGLVITITTTVIFYVLKAANVLKLPSLDAMFVVKLIKDYVVYKMDQRMIKQQNFMAARGNKITQCQM